ncbi:MAG TPA: AAA family ATPase [Actinomycetota bacterium]|nr:AAA family ATPase [Actinomycetota bacterium]
MPSWLKILWNPAFIIAAVVIVGGSLVALRQSKKQMTHKLSSFAPKSVKLNVDQPTVTFSDVAGLDDVVAELKEVKDYLTDPTRFSALGAQLPRGLLLYGPPGSGKTLMARALAGETGAPFYSVSASSFVEVYVGVGAARVRQLFEEAKKNTPSIVFIDELDAVGRRRSADVGGDREFDHTLNQLLVELDGFAMSHGVVLIGATNRPELIDPALLRPGRFDRRIHVDKPDVGGRLAILRLHASRRPFSGQVDWMSVARRTPGLSGAELANIINEASFLAARQHRERITQEEVEEAVERVVTGQRSNKPISDDQKRLIAYHEAGHALLSLLLRGIRPVARVSIIGRMGGLGRSNWSASDDGEVMTRRELMSQLMVLLGGRAAEKITFGEPSTRAEDDLEQAWELARRMVNKWGMTDRLDEDDSDYAPRHADRDGRDPTPEREAKALIMKAEQAARSILSDNKERLAAIADGLIRKETLIRSEIAHLAGLQSLIPEEDRDLSYEPEESPGLAPVRELPFR